MLERASFGCIVLRQFSRRTDAIHYLSHVTEEGLFAVTQSSPPTAEDVAFTVTKVWSLGLSGQADKTLSTRLIYQEGGKRSAALDIKEPQAPTVPEGTVAWQLPDHMLFLRSEDADFKASTLVPPQKRAKSA